MALSAARLGLVRWDLRTGTARWSPELEALWGLAPGSFSGTLEDLLAAVHPEDQSVASEKLREAIAHPHDFTLIFRVRWPDGSIHRIALDARVARDAAQKPLRIVAIARDSTAGESPHLAPEAPLVSEREARLETRGTLDRITDGFIVIDRQWRFRYLNPRAATLARRTADQLIGASVWEVFPELIGSVGWTLLHRAMHEHVAVHYETYYQPYQLWLEVHGYPSQDGLTIYVQDITRRKAAEEALRESEDRFRSIVELAVDAVIVSDAGGRIISWNRGAESMFGYREEDVLGRPLTLLLPERYREQYERALQMQEPGRTGALVDLYGLRKDGSEFPIAAALATWQSGGVQFSSAIIRDITFRKDAEQALRDAKDAAVRASQSKSELLSRASHELRTPLNAILGFAQVLEFEDLPPHSRESVAHILRAGRELLALVNSVLEISAVESGRSILSIAPVSVDELAEEVVNALHSQAAQQNVHLYVERPAGAQQYVLADQWRLKQVLFNLVSNAIIYNRRQGSASLTWFPDDDDCLRIVVRDTGPGIPSTKLEQLFSPFERAGAEKSDVPGAGLGLAVAKALVEAMGGTIGVASAVGEGSSFWISLQRATAVTPSLPAPSGAEAQLRRATPRRLLYIGQNSEQLKQVERLLSAREPATLAVVGQAEVGLAFAREQSPDLIFLELTALDDAGEHALRELRGAPDLRRVPVVALGGRISAQQRLQLLALGAQACLTVPGDEHLFWETIESLLQA